MIMIKIIRILLKL